MNGVLIGEARRNGNGHFFMHRSLFERRGFSILISAFLLNEHFQNNMMNEQRNKTLFPT